MARTAWTAADLPDLSGRTVVVTGGSRGLGKVIATELARAGASVTLGVRDLAKGTAAAETIERTHQRAAPRPGGPDLGPGLRRRLEW